jgi:predicted acylesterase/phospholipase RssA
MAPLHAIPEQSRYVRAVERTLMRGAVDKPGALAARELHLLRYALAFAAIDQLKTPHRDNDVFELVSPFRHWLLEELAHYIHNDDHRSIDWSGLRYQLPRIARQLQQARAHVLEHEAANFAGDRLDDEVTRKRLVLVLGGGGGCGYAHLGAFAVLSELGIAPGLIVGSSMGALLGLFRAVTVDYDPLTTVFALPRPAEVGRVFSAYRGYSRWGFPGGLELNARAVGTGIFANLLGKPVPTIRELPIPFRAVVTGVRTGIGVAVTEIENEIERAAHQVTPFALRRRISLFVRLVRTMVDRPVFLRELAFGGPEDGLEDFSCVDAVGFSCAVPGVIHYDIYQKNDESAETLQRLFDEHRLFRLTDGGVVNNVPSRVAYGAVQRGEIGTRNAFILAFDAFAPLVNSNALFLPVQQIARAGVLENRPYSDWHITFRSPPSPVDVLKNVDTLEKTIARVREELEPHRAFIASMMRPIPRWDHLIDDFYAGS